MVRRRRSSSIGVFTRAEPEHFQVGGKAPRRAPSACRVCSSATSRFVFAAQDSPLRIYRLRPSTKTSRNAAGSCLQVLCGREGQEGARQATAVVTWQPAARGHERAGSPRHLSDPAGDAVRSRLDRIVSQVGVAGGGLNLGVTQELADHGQAFADEQSTAGKAMPQIVYSHIVEPRPSPDAPPGVLQVGEMAPRLATRDHPRVVVLSLDAAQHRDRRVAQMHHLGARLGIREPELAGVQVDMLPP